MSGRLPRLTAADIIRIVQKKGFYLARQSGGHKIYKNEDGIRLTVPFHKGKILHPKIIKDIIKDAKIDKEDLL